MRFLLMLALGLAVNTAYAAKPVILFTGTDVSGINERGLGATISVIATDPDGIRDLIGGVLLDPNGSSYGVLSAAADEGAYTFTVDWQHIQRVNPITFGKSGMAKKFIVRLFDQQGESADAPITLNLLCSNPIESACDGTCVSLDYDPLNCGSCGVTLNSLMPPIPPKDNITAVCRPGGPQLYYSLNEPKHEACDSICAGVGLSCKGLPRIDNPYSNNEYAFYRGCTKNGCYGKYWWTGQSTDLPLRSCSENPAAGPVVGCFCSLP